MRRGGARRWTITLRHRDGLRLGGNLLAVDARSKQREGFDAVSFRYARRSSGLLHIVAPVRGARRAGGPVAVTPRAARGGRIAAWLNGHSLAARVGQARRSRPGTGPLRFTVGASPGLRFGHNPVAVRAYRAGRYQWRTRVSPSAAADRCRAHTAAASPSVGFRFGWTAPV